MEEKFKQFSSFIERLAFYYANKFSISSDDLYQEGCLAFLMTYDRYKQLKDDDLNAVLRKVINRAIYAKIKEETNRRRFEVALEPAYDENREGD